MSWLLIVKQLSRNKIKDLLSIYTYLACISYLNTHTHIYIFNSSAVKGEQANVLLALYHCFCSPGQMHC